MRFRALTEAEWGAVADAMAAQALYATRLLSGEMPEQIEEAFRAAGVTLFPADEGDLETDCTCPDWANPCKHVAAAFYLPRPTGWPGRPRPAGVKLWGQIGSGKSRYSLPSESVTQMPVPSWFSVSDGGLPVQNISPFSNF